MTFKAYMDSAIDPADCGEFIEPGNIRSTKGQIYTPRPRCDSDERLNDSRTKCVEKPQKEEGQRQLRWRQEEADAHAEADEDHTTGRRG